MPPPVLDLRLVLRCPHLKRAATHTTLRVRRIPMREITLTAHIRGRHPGCVVTFLHGRQLLGVAPVDTRNATATLTLRSTRIRGFTARYAGTASTPRAAGENETPKAAVVRRTLARDLAHPVAAGIALIAQSGAASEGAQNPGDAYAASPCVARCRSLATPRPARWLLDAQRSRRRPMTARQQDRLRAPAAGPRPGACSFK